MADRLDYFFRQKVTDAELDLGFSLLEASIRNFAADLNVIGVAENGDVTQHSPVSDLTVDISGPMLVYDQDGQRIFASALQNLNMAVDENTVSTAIVTPGNSRILSIFVEFDRALSDPRVDKQT